MELRTDRVSLLENEEIPFAGLQQFPRLLTREMPARIDSLAMYRCRAHLLIHSWALTLFPHRVIWFAYRFQFRKQLMSSQSELLTKRLLPSLYYSHKVEKINVWALKV